jgi:ferrous iron transport protein A
VFAARTVRKGFRCGGRNMTLREGTIGGEYLVRDIQLEDKVKRRLQMLGLTEGTGVSILNNKKSGSIIMKVRGTRFAIGKRIAEGILVEEGTDE